MMVEQVVLQPCISTKTAWAVRGWGLLAPYCGECKADSGLDHGLDYELECGLNSRLILAMVASQD